MISRCFRKKIPSNLTLPSPTSAVGILYGLWFSTKCGKVSFCHIVLESPASESHEHSLLTVFIGGGGGNKNDFRSPTGT
jgi:hypothetical protein